MSPLHPGTGEVTGWWNADSVSLLLEPLVGRTNEIILSADAYGEFSCKLSQTRISQLPIFCSPKVEGLASVRFLCFTVLGTESSLVFLTVSFQQQLGGWRKPTLNIQ